MKQWQIYSKNSGRLYTIIKSVTPEGALDKYAQNNNFDSWQKWNEYLGLSTTYTVLEGTDKIVVS